MFRINGTCHHEILPDHDAVAVAEIKEFVGFINSAAPAADHVALKFIEELQHLIDSVFIAGVKRIERDMVAAFDPDRDSVDFDAEFALPAEIELRSFQFDGSDSELCIEFCLTVFLRVIQSGVDLI